MSTIRGTLQVATWPVKIILPQLPGTRFLVAGSVRDWHIVCYRYHRSLAIEPCARRPGQLLAARRAAKKWTDACHSSRMNSPWVYSLQIICKPKEKFTMKRFSRALVVVTFLAVAGTGLYGQSQAPSPARSRAEETLEWWNQIGNKLIAMAKDFPEDKYDFKLQEDERSFAQNLLHVAAADYDLIRRAAGSNIGPDFGKDAHNPSRDVQDQSRRGEAD